MKKRVLFACATLCGLTGMAWAQSTVTVFGVIDLNLRSVSNSGGTSLRSMGTDGISSSRFGFRGTEDLGSGLKTSFWLESAFSPDVGTSNATKFFNRASWVSLESSRLGELRLGREYTPTAYIHTAFDPFNGTGVGSSKNTSNVKDLIPTYTRADNSISYFLPPDLGGFYGHAMVALGEGGPGKHLGASLGWASGPARLVAGYGRTDLVLGGARRGITRSIAASYDFGFAKLLAEYNMDDFETPASVRQRDKRWFIAGTVPMGSGQFKVLYGRTDQSGTPALDANDSSQIAVGYQYNLSRRTALYGNYARLHNKGTGRQFIAAGPAAIAAGGTSRGIEAGIRHTF